MAEHFVEAYRRYCWPVMARRLRLAPFQLLAGEGAVHADRTTVAPRDARARLAGADAVAARHPYRVVDLDDPTSARPRTIAWWESSPAPAARAWCEAARRSSPEAGGARPAGIKCRGREYLRIIYGPEYTAPRTSSGCGGGASATSARSPLREFALGIEALDRFVAGSRSTVCTSACSACSRWRASRSTHACRSLVGGSRTPAER